MFLHLLSVGRLSVEMFDPDVDTGGVSAVTDRLAFYASLYIWYRPVSSPCGNGVDADELLCNLFQET